MILSIFLSIITTSYLFSCEQGTRTNYLNKQHWLDSSKESSMSAFTSYKLAQLLYRSEPVWKLLKFKYSQFYRLKRASDTECNTFSTRANFWKKKTVKTIQWSDAWLEKLRVILASLLEALDHISPSGILDDFVSTLSEEKCLCNSFNHLLSVGTLVSTFAS